ncbi:VOC family protein [Sphingomonas sp.]|uniref:VOC family protein n=1 Tax=Sphingomonas sp. TaxID=28214 RepID=UPI003D6D195D
MKAKSTPKGYHSLTPYIAVEDVAKAVDFYKTVFGATEIIKREMGGRVLLAGLLIGDSHLMISDLANEGGSAPERIDEPKYSGVRVYLDDVDAAFARALAAGATQVSAVEDQFYGDRVGTLIDPFGNAWRLSQHLEDLSGDEIERRMVAHGGRSQRMSGASRE